MINVVNRVRTWIIVLYQQVRVQFCCVILFYCSAVGDYLLFDFPEYILNRSMHKMFISDIMHVWHHVSNVVT